MPRLNRCLTAAALVLASLSPRVAASQGFPALDSIVPTLMKRYDVPGVALAVVQGNRVTALKGFGVARVRDSARVDPERTLFRLASVAKLFVATAVTQQLEAGALDTATDVARYLDFPLQQIAGGGASQPITLARLLTHTAGFDERIIRYGAPSRDSVAVPGALGRHLASNLPNRGWPPGVAIGYSNYGFALAAWVVERTTGAPYDRYARERIFLPLGMTRTHYVQVPDSLKSDVADGHFCGDPCRTAPEVFSRPYPVGLAYSTAHDMAQFIIAELNGGANAAGRILNPASLRVMQDQRFTLDRAPAGDQPGMSFGFFNQRHLGHRALAHAGNVPGINNLLLIVPDAKVGFYFVANGGRTAFGAALRDTLLRMLVTPRPSSRRPAVQLSDAWLATLAGNYQLTRYAHRTIEAFPSLFATSVKLFADSGRMVLPYPNGAVAFEPVDSTHFREVAGDRVIAFALAPDGSVRSLAASIPVFGAELPGLLERRAWHEGARFMNEYISYLAMLPLIFACLWGAWVLALLVIARYRARSGVVQGAQPTPSPRVVPALLAAFAALWLWFGFGFIARSVRMFEQGNGIVFEVPTWMRLMSAVPWALAALAAVLLASAVLAWRRGWWDYPRRALLTLAAINAVLVIAFLVRWNYLPVVF